MFGRVGRIGTVKASAQESGPAQDYFAYGTGIIGQSESMQDVGFEIALRTQTASEQSKLISAGIGIFRIKRDDSLVETGTYSVDVIRIYDDAETYPTIQFDYSGPGAFAATPAVTVAIDYNALDTPTDQAADMAIKIQADFDSVQVGVMTVTSSGPDIIITANEFGPSGITNFYVNEPDRPTVADVISQTPGTINYAAVVTNPSSGLVVLSAHGDTLLTEANLILQQWATDNLPNADITYCEGQYGYMQFETCINGDLTKNVFVGFGGSPGPPPVGPAQDGRNPPAEPLSNYIAVNNDEIDIALADTEYVPECVPCEGGGGGDP